MEIELEYIWEKEMRDSKNMDELKDIYLKYNQIMAYDHSDIKLTHFINTFLYNADRLLI